MTSSRPGVSGGTRMARDSSSRVLSLNNTSTVMGLVVGPERDRMTHRVEWAQRGSSDSPMAHGGSLVQDAHTRKRYSDTRRLVKTREPGVYKRGDRYVVVGRAGG